MPATDRPNVVFLIADQWRAEATGYCGNPVIKTPKIDALAADGAGFRRCFVQNPVSTPSRVALASGRYPHVAGHRTMHHHLRAHEPNMLRTFKENGYHVWWGGKNDMIAMECADESCDERPERKGGRPPGQFGSPHEPGTALFYSFLWGKVPPEHSGNDDFVVDAAREFLARPPADKPFFMLINQGYPHPPYAAADPWFSMYDRAEVPFPRRQKVPFEKKPRILKAIHERGKLGELTEADWRELVAVYYAMCSKVDDNFGRVIEALKEHGHYDNTVIIATSDHGDFAGDYLVTEKGQNTFEDVLTNVPLAIRAPGCAPLAEPTGALVQWIDLMPTVFEFAGIEAEETIFGRSLAPILRGEAEKIRDYAWCEGGALPEEEHTHEHDAPPENPYWCRLGVQRQTPELHAKAVMIRSERYKYVRRMLEPDELYDLETDPEELENRIDDPALAEVKRELEGAMLDWFLETGDAVPWRWSLRSPKEKHPPWSERAKPYGTV